LGWLIFGFEGPNVMKKEKRCYSNRFHRKNREFHRKKFRIAFILLIFGIEIKTKYYETEKITDRFGNPPVYFRMYRFLHDLLVESLLPGKEHFDSFRD
jgi:hypothetical protein